MKLSCTILSMLFTVVLAAQVSFKTEIPQLPVVEGEAFQVQYVLTGAEKTNTIRTPVFPGFRVTSGPNYYSGVSATEAGPRLIQNFVYTLEAVRPGKYVIPSAIVAYNNKPLQSNEVMIRVISKEEAANGAVKKEGFNPNYYLRPGEDPYQKIRENLFVKVQLDRTNCFTGEPVLATFKLYSRLESRSDIIKNPGFYGFTVYDMVNLADKQVSTEKINGNLFDVHTIRKVQLYPLQAGDFTIDPMEVKNSVEFSRSRVSKKTEQEIAEGMMGVETEEETATGTELFETHTRTSPVTVHVKPWPEKNKPDTFSGATGRFHIKARLTDPDLAKNEEGFLEIVVSGKGNFIQLDAPKISWPAGVEAFEPTVKDELDKTKTPLAGQRIFRYPFVCAAPGKYDLSAVKFSFFDTDSNQYKTVSTKPLVITVSNEEKRTVFTEENSKRPQQNERTAWIAAVIALGLVAGVILYWTFNKKEDKQLPVEGPVKRTSTNEFLQPVQAVIADDREFYMALRNAIWAFAEQNFGLSGSGMSKHALSRQMNEKGIAPDTSRQLLGLLEDCEAGMFTTASLEHDKEELLQQTRVVFETIERSLL